MVLADWSFYQGNTIIIGTASPVSDTSESAPYVTGNSSNGFLFPTNGLINGVSSLGLNSGQVSYWTYSTSSSSSNTRTFFFRITSAITTATSNSAGLSCYAFVDAFGNSPNGFVRYDNGAVTTLNNRGNNSGHGTVWLQNRVSWWESAGSLYLKAEERTNAANPWVQVASTVLDASNAHKSSTNSIAWNIVATNGNWRLEGVRVSSQISA